MEHDERGIERLEIEGDVRDALEREFANKIHADAQADMADAHYFDWCERNGIVLELVPIGKGTDPEGEEVSVYTFA